MTTVFGVNAAWTLIALDAHESSVLKALRALAEGGEEGLARFAQVSVQELDTDGLARQALVVRGVLAAMGISLGDYLSKVSEVQTVATVAMMERALDELTADSVERVTVSAWFEAWNALLKDEDGWAGPGMVVRSFATSLLGKWLEFVAKKGAIVLRLPGK
ncbi:hypothetical protein A2368_01425 [Candidatus Collierbacteria bacterium RIFOXYB1_FULL_49_13]|uniref:Uncharacterized protein n=1 Tax=Candidatus Collierbacteria bacterium RIFOXYB1_FULL_49_13 TaxID=1817728 RepID=A0A1F5FFX2_9BACT|nr:MAG: hypothetical protein A2368_01425 [Candidatus Collierbacteria bacterium RIFOXYB1_FULL_49_13]